MKYILLSFLFLTACDSLDDPAWEHAAETHVCSADQMKKVETESEYCDVHSGYSNTYCYSTAIMRNCDARDAGGTPIHKPAT